jgi:hypothetical protein
MTARGLADGVPLEFALPNAPRQAWDFLKVEPLMAQPGDDNPLLRRLRVADKLFLKAWLVSPPLKAMGGVITVAMLAALAWGVWRFWRTELLSLTVGEALVLVGGAALSLMGMGWAFKVINYRKTVEQVLVGIGLSVVGAFLARLHLHMFDRIFLRHGCLARLLAEWETSRSRE